MNIGCYVKVIDDLAVLFLQVRDVVFFFHLVSDVCSLFESESSNSSENRSSLRHL